MTRLPLPIRILLLATLVLGASACQRTPPPAPADAAGEASSRGTAPAAGTPTPATQDDTPPEGALRAYVWRCDDGQTLVMRNLFRERAIAVDFHDGTKRLDQTRSASGVRYANGDESLVFWTKGSAATLERQGSTPVKCEERRADSLREDARARGVVYRALGNEPGWTLEIGPGGRIDWNTNYGQERHAFDGAVEAAAATGNRRTYSASAGTETITVTVAQEPCTDDGGVRYDHTATIDFDGGELRGCATKLN